ncbi:MAG: class I SAM-dependent methyltransferase, partial [Bacteroidota bacterium]
MSFDRVADIYDKTFTYSHIGRLQRELVHRYLDQWIGGRKGLKVLELNCGTGEDALFLARQGCEVLATDLSMPMVQVARDKIRATQVERQVRFQQMAIEELVQCPVHEQYDLIFSNFGGFNCISPRDLASLQEALADRLRPGGYL